MPEGEIDKYFIIDPLKKMLIEQYAEQFQINTQKGSIYVHHEDNIRRVQFHNQGVAKSVTCLKEFLDSLRLESLFDPEGLPLQCTDKACFMKGLEEHS